MVTLLNRVRSLAASTYGAVFNGNRQVGKVSFNLCHHFLYELNRLFTTQFKANAEGTTWFISLECGFESRPRDYGAVA